MFLAVIRRVFSEKNSIIDVSLGLKYTSEVMVKDNTLLHKVIDLLCSMINPFNQAEMERLYNIATEKGASVDTEQLLLSVNDRGEIQFIS